MISENKMSDLFFTYNWIATMSPFLDAFWPNLVSTLIGVVLGVPIALALNELVLRRQRRLQVEDLRQQARDSIEVLVAACRYNIGVLDTIRIGAEEGRVMHNPDLRLTTWEVVSPALFTIVSDPEILQMLSHHWLRLKRIQALSDEIFAREVAKSLPPIEDEILAVEFWKTLCENAYHLSAHALEAISMLERAKLRIGASSTSSAPPSRGV
ncbi:hypothetical protein [Pseudomonas sp. Irchel 3E13]|uniref:hypothetical protein n=1 Tax=Pseudomonas sp. Irchel 3E13 TaxID=2008975 RepID=UPI00117AD4FF|nr:hypothetical protein [Pseudomonas sp. Irchel 3E13]